MVKNATISHLKLSCRQMSVSNEQLNYMWSVTGSTSPTGACNSGTDIAIIRYTQFKQKKSMCVYFLRNCLLHLNLLLENITVKFGATDVKTLNISGAILDIYVTAKYLIPGVCQVLYPAALILPCLVLL